MKSRHTRKLSNANNLDQNPTDFTPGVAAFLAENCFMLASPRGYSALDELVDDNLYIFPADFEKLVRKALGLLFYGGEIGKLSRRKQNLKNQLLAVFQNARQFTEYIIRNAVFFLRVYAAVFKLRVKLFSSGDDGIFSRIFGEKAFESKIFLLLDRGWYYLMEHQPRQFLNSSALRLSPVHSAPARSPERTIREIYNYLVLIPFEIESENEDAEGSEKPTIEIKIRKPIRIELDDEEGLISPIHQDFVTLRTSSPRHQAGLLSTSSVCLGFEPTISDINKKCYSLLHSPAPTFSPSGRGSPNSRRSFSPNDEHLLAGGGSTNRNRLSVGDSRPHTHKSQCKDSAKTDKNEKNQINFKINESHSGFVIKPTTIEADASDHSLEDDLIVLQGGSCVAVGDNLFHQGVIESYSVSNQYGFVLAENGQRAIVVREEVELAKGLRHLPDDSSSNDLQIPVKCQLQKLEGAELDIFEAVNLEFL